MRNVLFCLIVLFFSVPVCPGEDFEEMLSLLYKDTVPLIQPEQLAKEMQSRELVLLDARERKEYDVSRLKDAVWAGYSDFDLTRVKDVDKGDAVIIYCSLGYRSERVAEQLQNAGYVNVRNLYGGIFNWVNQGFPVFDSNGETENVHAYSKFWGVWLKKGKKVLD